MKLFERKSRASFSLAGAIAVGSTMFSQMVAAETIRFWTTEIQPERMTIQKDIAAKFESESGVKVEIIPIDESDLGTRATAAFGAGDLPDVIYHPLQYALPWIDAGILDSTTATEVVEELGKDTFSAGALAMGETDGEYAAVPVDGWTQFIVYRKDLFDAAGLAAPRSYAEVIAAMDELHNPPQMYGFVPHLKVDDASMSQQLEYIFLANGLSPVGPDGIVPFDEAKTIEVLDFLKAIKKGAPEGELYWKQSREYYLAGRTAMIMWSPFLLDELAGLRDSAPPTINDDPTTRDLAKVSGMVTTFAGPSNKAGSTWADVRFFGITADANIEAAKSFVKYSMDQGYTQTLAIAPEGKFPIRQGSSEQPTKFVEAWAKLDVGVDRRAPLSELYPQEQIDELISGLDASQRWGANDGKLALASKILNSMFMNRIVRQYMEGEIDSSAAVTALNAELMNFK